MPITGQSGPNSRTASATRRAPDGQAMISLTIWQYAVASRPPAR